MRKAHTDEIVVTIFGQEAPSNLPNNSSKYMFGIWFSPQYSPVRAVKNMVELSTSRDENGAFVEAAIKALEVVEESLRREILPRGGRIILKSPSMYFDDVFTQYLDIWKTNGFMNLQGRPVRNKGFWQSLEERVLRLQSEYQTTVHNWQVEEEDIKPLRIFMDGTTWQWCDAKRLNEPMTEAAFNFAQRYWSAQRARHFRQYGTPAWVIEQAARDEDAARTDAILRRSSSSA